MQNLFENLQKIFVFPAILYYTEDSKVCEFFADTFMTKVCAITQMFAIVLNFFTV